MLSALQCTVLQIKQQQDEELSLCNPGVLSCKSGCSQSILCCRPVNVLGKNTDRQQMLLVPELYSLREATTGHIVGEGAL